MPERYLSPDEVCEVIPGVTRNLLAQMRFRGDGPPFVKPSPKKVAYPSSKLYAWLEDKTQQSTKESA
jgi:hypothetical protein